MFRKLITITGLLTMGASAMLADFSYTETHTVTGGAIVAAMKVVGVFSKSARQMNEPIESTIAVKGDRMVQRTADHREIIDLANQTITSIDMQKKTYSVLTFEEMKQALEQMQQKMSKSKAKDGQNAEMKFKVQANSTGKAKQVGGFDAKEMVLTMTMEATDTQSGQSGSMVVIADQWIAPQVPGYDEVKNFYRRMAEKLNWTPGGNMFMSRPDVAQGMAEVYKETAKLDGIPVFQTTTMGPEGTQPVDRSEHPAQQASQEKKGPSVKGALGGALGGRFGLGRRKSEPQPEAQPAPEGGGNSPAPGVLIEMTSELKDFSANAVDASQFEVPAGFKQVQSDLKRGMQ